MLDTHANIYIMLSIILSQVRNNSHVLAGYQQSRFCCFVYKASPVKKHTQKYISHFFVDTIITIIFSVQYPGAKLPNVSMDNEIVKLYIHITRN